MVNPSVIKLMLPKANGEATMSKKMITVSIDAQKNIAVDDVPVSFDMLESTLQSKVAAALDPTVILKVDASLSVQEFVDVLDVGAKLKLKMVLAVQKK
jgi:biopolymer transport protein ExbD